MSTEHHPATTAVAVGATRQAASAVYGRGHEQLVLTDFDGFAELDLEAVGTVLIAAGVGMRPVLESSCAALARGGPRAVLVEYPGQEDARSIVREVLTGRDDVVVGAVRSEDGAVVLELTRSDRGTSTQVFEALDLPRSGERPRSATPTASRPAGGGHPLRSRRFRAMALLGLGWLVVLAVVAALVGRSDAGTSGALVVLVVGALLTIVAATAAQLLGLARVRGEVRQQREALRRVRGLLDRRTDRILQSARTPQERLPDLAAIRGYVEEVAAENARSRALQQELHLQSQRQVQALLTLQQVVTTGVRIPPMGGRATSPDLVLLVLEEMLAGRPETVLACGSGVSTVLLALAARQHGLDTRIVSLEPLEQVVHQTEIALARHGVGDVAEVRWAPGYPTASLEGLDQIGVLVLGAGPSAPGGFSRYPAVPLLRDRLSPDTVVILDDLDAEQELQQWRELLPDFSYEQLDELQKPAGVFRRAAPHG